MTESKIDEVVQKVGKLLEPHWSNQVLPILVLLVPVLLNEVSESVEHDLRGNTSTNCDLFDF